MSRPSILAAVFLLAVALPALACNVPVFRYALERWNPDAYEVHLFHRGPLTAEQRKLVEMMAAQVVGKERQLDSFYINEVDVADPMDDRTRAIHAALKPAEYPFVAVQFPRSQPADPPAYAGPLTADLAAHLADSPVRRELAKRILAGDSVVWVLLESGDRTKDDAAAALLAKELDRLAGQMTLPELDHTDEKYHDPDAGPKLKLAFSMLRLSRTAAGEAIFVRLLENWDPKTADPTEPAAFAVFGRGRVMPPLKGKHLTAPFIEAACEFMVGRCSCQVKEENPGWDLLMPVNWDAVMKGQASLTEAMPKLTTPAAIVQQNETMEAGTQAAIIAANQPAPPPPAAPRGSMMKNVMMLVVIGFVLALAGTMWLRLRRT